MVVVRVSEPVAWCGGLAGGTAPRGQSLPSRLRPKATPTPTATMAMETDVQPVVGLVDRNEVGRTVMVYAEAIDDERRVCDTAAGEIRAGATERPGQGDPSDTKCQVHQAM